MPSPQEVRAWLDRDPLGKSVAKAMRVMAWRGFFFGLAAGIGGTFLVQALHG